MNKKTNHAKKPTPTPAPEAQQDPARLPLKYSVKTLREAGLEAKWSKTRNGAPILLARWPEAELDHQRQKFWFVDRMMWSLMQRMGVVRGFDSATLLGDVFFV